MNCKKSMLEQLDVFLKLNTNSFVEKFLEVAKSKSYLPVEKEERASVSPTGDIEPHSGNSPDSTTANVTTNLTSIPSPSCPPPLPPLPPLPPAIPHPPPENTPPYPPTIKKEEATSTIKTTTKATTERDERRIRRRSRSRDKSRSRSRDRNRRSRSRGRINRNKYDERRRRSPHMKRYRRSSRSRSPRWSRSPPRRSRSRDRQSRNRTRSASPLRNQPRHRTRSRSPLNGSPKNTDKDKDESPSPDAKDKTTANSGPPDTYPSSKSQRCRDYDVQGFCMRGDQCPYDHGADPFVLEGGHLDFPPPITGGVPTIPPTFPPISGGSIPPPVLTDRAFLRHPPPVVRPSQFDEYTPSNPNMWVSNAPPFFGPRGRNTGGVPRFPGPPPPIVPNPDRELINIHVDRETQNKNIRQSLANRLGPVTSNPGLNFSNHPSSGSKQCTLELRKIPTGLNSITHLNGHFAKIGTIINIQVHHDGDPEAALITFGSNSEASAAYRSTEAVLNNRFIKLFWHNTAKGEGVSQRSVHVPHERMSLLRNPNKSLNNKTQVETDENGEPKVQRVVVARGSLLKTVYNNKPTPAVPSNGEEEVKDENSSAEIVKRQPLTPAELKKKEMESILLQQELLKAELLSKQKQEKQKIEALKKKQEIESRTKQLLTEQMQHVKLMLKKLEDNKTTMKQEELKKMVDTIKSLQNAIEITKSRIMPPKIALSKSQLNKEILDTELEMYNLQSEGHDVSRVRSRLLQLKSRSMNIRGGKHSKIYNATLPSSTAVVHRGGMRGRGGISRPYRGGRGGRGGGSAIRGGRGGGSAIDRRTTCINASGFEREDKDQVLAHFSGLGNLTNYVWDDQTPTISVQFETRKEAETVMTTEGRTLGDRLLTLTWVAAPACFSPPRPTSVSSSAEVEKNSVLKQQKSPSAVPACFVLSPTNNPVVLQEEGEEIIEEITEEIVEEVTEETIMYEDEVDEEEDEGRSWRR